MSKSADWNKISEKLQSIKNKPDELTSKEWGSIVENISSLKRRKDKKFDPDRNKEETKSTLAKWYVICFFIVLLSTLIYVPVYNYFTISFITKNTSDVLNVKDVFVMVAGQLGPLLGFVFGHYFKNSD